MIDIGSGIWELRSKHSSTYQLGSIGISVHTFLIVQLPHLQWGDQNEICLINLFCKDWMKKNDIFMIAAAI